MKIKSNQRLGTLTEKDINFPKWLTPEVVHTALYIHNAPSKEDIVKRTEYMSKQIGGEAMTFAMALLVLPNLIDNTVQSQDYKDFQKNKYKSLN
jgi:hypothetical protein